jgi:hypothetical protein
LTSYEIHLVLHVAFAIVWVGAAFLMAVLGVRIAWEC